MLLYRPYYCVSVDNVDLDEGHGLTYSEGDVEVHNRYTDRHGIVCDRNWDLRDADVVCRHLRYPGALQALTRSHFTSTEYAEGSILNAFFTDVDCVGNEESIFDCLDIYGNALDVTTVTPCPSQNIAGVICKSKYYNK